MGRLPRVLTGKSRQAKDLEEQDAGKLARVYFGKNAAVAVQFGGPWKYVYTTDAEDKPVQLSRGRTFVAALETAMRKADRCTTCGHARSLHEGSRGACTAAARHFHHVHIEFRCDCDRMAVSIERPVRR